MTIVKEEEVGHEASTAAFDSFHFATATKWEIPRSDLSSVQKAEDSHLQPRGSSRTAAGIAAVAGALVPLTLAANQAIAAAAPVVDQFTSIKKAIPTPETFQPLCPASDGFYRILQSTAAATIGPEVRV